MNENWLPIPGFEGCYEVSDHGQVRSLPRRNSRGVLIRGRILKHRLLPNGRPRVHLCVNGSKSEHYVYHLVLNAFVGPRPPGLECLHWDDDSSNNELSNLRWGTRTENMRDMSRNLNGNAGITHCPAGHPYDTDNTYIYPSERQHRGCRACGRNHSHAKRLRARQNSKKAA